MQQGNFIYGTSLFTLHSTARRGIVPDHQPPKNSVQKTICCNSTSKAPDDGRMYPKHVELRIYP